jgi:hypothetical protein
MMSDDSHETDYAGANHRLIPRSDAQHRFSKDGPVCADAGAI